VEDEVDALDRGQRLRAEEAVGVGDDGGFHGGEISRVVLDGCIRPVGINLGERRHRYTVRSEISDDLPRNLQCLPENVNWRDWNAC
jgi:hypothetical protein